jgi:hypothetical protein
MFTTKTIFVHFFLTLFGYYIIWFSKPQKEVTKRNKNDYESEETRYGLQKRHKRSVPKYISLQNGKADTGIDGAARYGNGTFAAPAFWGRRVSHRV